MRFFTTTGPVKPDRHYCIPPLDRLDLDELLAFVRDEKYFVLHAPRQTGKTTALLALRDRLNGDGYRCVYVNVEVGQTAREDVGQAMRTVLGRLASQARMTLGDEFLDGVFRDLLAQYAPHDVLLEALTRWAETDATPHRRVGHVSDAECAGRLRGRLPPPLYHLRHIATHPPSVHGGRVFNLERRSRCRQ